MTAVSDIRSMRVMCTELARGGQMQAVGLGWENREAAFDNYFQMLPNPRTGLGAWEFNMCQVDHVNYAYVYI